MLKFKDKDGNVKFVLRDTDTQPVEVKDIAEDVLAEYGIKVNDDDKPKDKKHIETQGLSQDDLAILKARI